MTDHKDLINDRAEGSTKQAGGKVEEGAGKLFGDEKMKREVPTRRRGDLPFADAVT